MDELMIYIHIPFCVKKCNYCDFLSFAMGHDAIEAYCKRLKEEIREESEAFFGKVVTSVFIGGGTPSILTKEQIASVLQTLKESYQLSKDCEVTMECNPGTLDEEKLLWMRKAGINRLSIGLQSAHSKELELLGRIHSFEDFQESFRLARKAGFDNINVDVMFALPKQTLESYLDSLKKVCELRPEHISAYSLIIEEGTPFKELYKEDQRCIEKGLNPAVLPDEDAERRMYEQTEQFLSQFGYHRYEISNYSLDGQECRHNKGYWTRKDYLGLGLGASSLIHNQRWKQTKSMENYLEQSQRDIQVLSLQEQMEEFVFLGLRLMDGISYQDFEQAFHVDFKSVYETVLEKNRKDYFLLEDKDRLRLTKKGIDMSNYILAEFLLD